MLIRRMPEKGEGLRGEVSPTPLMGFPETRSSATVSGLGFQVPRLGRRGFCGSDIYRLTKRIGSVMRAIAEQQSFPGDHAATRIVPDDSVSA